MIAAPLACILGATGGGDPPYRLIERIEMARKPNYRFERFEREKAKAAKKAARAEAKAKKSEARKAEKLALEAGEAPPTDEDAAPLDDQADQAE